jgi:hypothetical protein
MRSSSTEYGGRDHGYYLHGGSVNDVFYNDRSIVKTSRHAFEIGETAARILLQNSKSPKGV